MIQALLSIFLLFSIFLFVSFLLSWLKARHVNKCHPALGKFLEIDGERIHYTDEGEGQPLVLIHGLYGCGKNFTCSLTKELKQNFRIIVLDRPGAGYSSRRRKASANFYYQAKIVADFIKKLNLEKPLIVGHSMGGAISLALAIKSQNIIRGLVLLAPLTQVQETPPAVFKDLKIPNRSARFIIAWTLAIPIALFKQKRIVAEIFHPDEVPEDFEIEGGGVLSLRPSSFYSASTDMVEANHDLGDMVGQYHTLRLPIGMVFGDEDNVLDYKTHGLSLKSQIPHIKCHVSSGKGHMLPITAVNDVVSKIKEIATLAEKNNP